MIDFLKITLLRSLCFFSLILLSQHAQSQTINTTLGTVTGVCVGDTVVVPVTVTMASGISTSALAMTIDYDTTKLRCISSVTSLNSNIATGFLTNCGLFSNLNPGSGPFTPTTRRQFRAAWFALAPVAFNGLMFNLRFVALASTSGSTPIAWDLNTAGNCEYADELADVIPNCTFANGSLTIASPASISAQPSGSTSITAGGNTSFSVSAAGNPTYQWQELTVGGSWSNISNGGVYGGATTATLTITGASTALNGNQYRVIVTGGCGAPVTSNALTLSVTTNISISTTLGTIAGVCVGDTVVVPVTVTMASGISISGISMTIDYDTTKLRCISSVTSLNSNIATGFLSNCGLFSNLNPGSGPFTPTTRRQFRAAWFALTPVAFNGLMFNLRFVALASTSGSTPIAWDLNTAGNCEYADELADVIPNCTFVNGSSTIASPASISAQPSGATSITAGGNTSFTITAAGSPTYQWQELTVGGSWSNISNGGVYGGATTATLTITSATVALNGNQYRVIVTGGCGAPLTSTALTLSVTANFSISTALGTVAGVCVGDTVVVPVTVTMASGISISAISMAIDYDTTKLRCISSVTSLNNNIATGFLSNCGLFSNLNPGTGPFTPTTRRQFRMAWFALTPVAFNGLMFNLRFVALASTVGSTPIAWDLNTAGNCEYADELAEVIPNCTFVNGSSTIASPASISAQPSGSTSIAAGGNTSFSVSAAGNPTYQWQELTVGGSWSNISNGGVYGGATTATLTITGASTALNGNQYRVIVTGGCGAPLTSTALTLSVTGSNATGLIAGHANGCQGDTVLVPISVSGLNAATGFSFKLNLPAGITYVGLANIVSGIASVSGSVASGVLTINWSGSSFTQASGTLMNLRLVLGAQGGSLAWDNTTSVTPNTTLSYTNGSLGVTPLPVIVTQPVAALTVAEFPGTSISAVTNNATNFRWQKQDVGLTTWADLNDNNLYSGTGTAVLNISSASLSLNGARYRLRMSSGTCPAQVNSSVCTLTVTPMQITLNALGANACAGDTVTIPVRVSGANAISNMSIYLIYSASNLAFLPALTDSLLNANISVQAITSPTPRIFVSYNAGPSINMNQTTLVRLHFRALGSSPLTWSNNSDFSNSIGDAVALTQITGVSSNVSVTEAVVTAAGSTSFCTGGSVVLNGNTIAGATYQWLNAAGPIAGATNASYTATTAGNYRFAVAVAGGCADTSAPVTVTTSAPPVAAITASGPTTFCQGGNVGLVATRGNGFTYRWYRDNTRLSNLAPNQDSIIALTSGVYRVVVMIPEGCSDSTASGILVTVKNKPQPPVISRPTTAPGWDSLFTNIRNQGNITWFFNGSPLQGGQDGVLRMVNNGIYQALQDSVGCQSDLSNAILYQCSVVILNHPSNQNALLNQNIQLSVLASLPNLNYQWQSDIGFGFQNLGNAGQYSGVQTPNLVISRVTLYNHRHFFRCIVSSSVCGSDTSDIAELTVSTAPHVGGVPQRFTYQSVLRDSLGQLLANQPVNIRLTLQRGPVMDALYSETHSLTTNANGLLSCIVGDGQVLLGSMDSIEWSLGQVYLKTEFTYNGSSNFSVLSNRELLSVPYALYALQCGSGGGSTGPQGPVGPQGPAGPQGPPGTGGGGAGVLATIRTLGATVRYTGALVEGSLDSDGGELVLSRGICVDTLPSPGTSKAVPHAGTGMGAYTVDLSGLTPGRTYHVRAYATTAAGTAFGQSLTLQTRALAVPAPVTLPATGLSAFGAQMRGELPDTSTGGLAVSSRGFRWSTASGFAPAAGQDLASQASAGTGYSAQVTGLSPSSNYYYRAYAVNALGTGYGQELSFSTGNQPLATVQTQAASSITQTQALVSGAVTADAGSAVSERGFCYSTQNSPSITSDTIRAGSGLGTFNGTLRNLTPNTTYYFRSYAVNGGGVAYGLVLSLQTPALALASINTRTVYGISNTIAYGGGTVTSDGGSSITQRGVVFDTVAGPTLTSNQTNDGTGAGSYTSLMTGLAPSTTYYVRAYANNALGTAYGNELSFNTTAQASGPVTPPLVGTLAVVKTDSNHIMGGLISGDGNSTITAQGICWNRTGSPTLSDSVRYFTPTGTGTYTLWVDLPQGCNETFYVRAFAQNSAGMSYGQEVSTTNGFVPKIGNSQLIQIGATTATLQTTILASGGCAVTERGVCWSISPNPTAGNALFRTACGADTGLYNCQLTNLIPQTLYYVRAYMNNVTGTYYGPEQTFTTDTTSALYIGKPYAGGIIFDLDSSGQHGLVCAPSNQGNFPWGCYGTDIPNTSTAVGTGATNTAYIMGGCSERPIAASVCTDLVLNGFSDWYLPSLGEFQTMYSRLHLQGLGGFGGGWYWSSSQHGPVFAWYRYFGIGDEYSVASKNNASGQVRAVRAF